MMILSEERKKMRIIFGRVLQNEDDKIEAVFEIIKSSGEHMHKNLGLIHWKTPYPKESIMRDCQGREVYLGRDLDTNRYVHTFQIEFTFPKSSACSKEIMVGKETVGFFATIHKFATLPDAEGQGIGKLSLEYIESYCRQKGIKKLCLDVYDRSDHAIQFYKNRGFEIVGSRPTRHFNVFMMEKLI